MDSPFLPLTTLLKSGAAPAAPIAVFAILALLAVCFVVGALGRRDGPAGDRLMILSALFGCIVAGLYVAAPPSPLSIALLLAGHLAAALFILSHGFQPPSAIPAPRSAWLSAIAVIALSTCLKLIELGDWPPLLTDYAALTGIEALGLSKEGRVAHLFAKSGPYLYGGGASPLHAPLLIGLYSILGHTVTAVRLAEVLGSVAALTSLWLVLQRLASPWAALAGLSLVAFSAEHLSQSRMGTFYSLSQALALLTLWLWLRIQRSSMPKRRDFAAIFVLTLLVPFGYSPLRAILLFSGAMAVVTLLRLRGSPRLRPAALAVALSVPIIAVWIFFADGARMGYLGPKPLLATDSAVWVKAAKASGGGIAQGVLGSLSLLVSNIRTLFVEQYLSDQSLRTEPIYEAGFTLLIVAAPLLLSSPAWRTFALFCLSGLLPMILTYPLLRRGLILRLFGPCMIMLFARELLLAIRQAHHQSGLRRAAFACTVAALALIPAHGLYLFGAKNGPVGTAPSFGPEYAVDMVLHVRKLIERCPVIILNSDRGQAKLQMMLAADNDRFPGGLRVRFRAVNKQDPEAAATLLREAPQPCLAILNESRRAWVVPWLQERFPPLAFEEHRSPDGKAILFWTAVPAVTEALPAGAGAP